jgi:hypothetical protein
MSVLDVFVGADVDVDDDMMPFGSDFSIHLPPAAPVLLFYSMVPSKQDPIRRLVKYSLTGATLSRCEASKYRRFSPMPVMHFCQRNGLMPTGVVAVVAVVIV